MRIRPGSNVEERDTLMRRLESEANGIEQLFPDQEDELGDLYVVTVDDDIAAGIIVGLQGSPAIDWIEEEPKRHLVG